jgi:hypothetical protein
MLNYYSVQLDTQDNLSISWYLVDRWGRRPILLSGAAVMAFALTAIGWFLYLNASFTPSAVVITVIIYNACVSCF